MSSLKRRKGFVLFIVLFFVSALASFLFSIFYLSQLSYRKTESLKEYVTDYHVATSAIKIALKFLQEDKNGFDGEGDNWWGPIVYNYRGVTVSLNIKDECGKLNLNALEEKRIYEALKRLLDMIGVETSLADSIKDWVDKDNQPMPFGAEKEFYEGLGYKPANGPMKSLKELLYVKGVDERLFNKLKDYLTIYGSGKINVNSAPEEVLMSLSPNMSKEAARSIVEARPIEDLSRIKELPGFSKELYYEIRPMITNRCNYFKIVASASAGEGTSQLTVFSSRRKVLEWKVVQ